MASSVRITDITSHWPKEPSIPATRVRRARTQFYISDFIPKFNGFPVMEMKNGKPQLKTYIPPKYRHAIRFINFKNLCYSAALKLNPGVIDLENQNHRKIAIARDAMTRNMVFNDEVRGVFFEEVIKYFYKGRLGNGKSPSVAFHPTTFRSATLDTWMIHEYVFFAHDPESCKGPQRLTPPKDPLEVGKRRLLHV